jgi:uncharacterized membrane protein
MENHQQSKTKSLQLILAVIPIGLLVFQLMTPKVLFENQKLILLFLSFLLLTISSLLNLKEDLDSKNKRLLLLSTVALGITTLIALNDLSKLYF